MAGLFMPLEFMPFKLRRVDRRKVTRFRNKSFEAIQQPFALWFVSAHMMLLLIRYVTHAAIK